MRQFNMTGERMPFTSGERAFQNYESQKPQKEPIKIGIGNIILFLIVAFLIGAVLVLDNRNDKLKAEIAEQDTLINHLEKVLDNDLKMHHKPNTK